MDEGQVARVLAKMAAFDRRTLGPSDVLAWHEVIGDLGFDDAMRAVNKHYSESDEWLQPATLRRLVAAAVRRRQRGRWAPGAYGVTPEEAKALEQPRAGTTDRSEDIRQMIAQLRTMLPEGDPQALRPRTVAWEREHRAYQRQAQATPNPHYDPGAFHEDTL